MLDLIISKSKNKEVLNDKELDYLINFPLEDISKLSDAAYEIKKYFFGNKVALCSIINAKSGRCPEDCKFCAQSIHFNTQADEYDFIDLDMIKHQAKLYKKAGVKNFSIVTSGTTIDDKTLPNLIEGIKIIRQEGLLADISVGILNEEQIEKIKEAGCTAFHHNLETSRSFFKNMCTTHEYDDDVNTVRLAVEAGMYVCCGGIFGLGESWGQRAELALTLKELKVHSIPINFLNPIKGTPYEHRQILSEKEALKIVALYRFILPDKQIRICGGRSAVFTQDRKQDVLKAGASGIMVGDYLTVKGFDLYSDIEMLKENNFNYD
jgi:biotin synthase